MIRLQIVEHAGYGLFRELQQAMRSGALRTFALEKRGRKVVHQRYPGWMNWSHKAGIITCEVLSPRKPGLEWQLLSSFIGRLADRYAGGIDSVTIQFPHDR